MVKGLLGRLGPTRLGERDGRRGARNNARQGARNTARNKDWKEHGTLGAMKGKERGGTLAKERGGTIWAAQVIFDETLMIFDEIIGQKMF